MANKERESKVKTPTIIDIQNLTPEEMLSLSNKVAENKGIVVALIHPYYQQHDDEYTGNIYELGRKVDHANRLQEYIENNAGVVFVFEQKSNIKSTRNRLSFINSDVVFCFVPTLEEDSTPSLLEKDSPKNLQWKELIAMFKRLGIELILAGGRDYFRTEMGEGGCVNGLKNNLGEDFNIMLIPTLCYPDKPALQQ